jgi:hypothetical protein
MTTFELDVEPGRVDLPTPILRFADGDVQTVPIASLDDATADGLRIALDRLRDDYERATLALLTELDMRDARYWMDPLFPELEEAA